MSNTTGVNSVAGTAYRSEAQVLSGFPGAQF
jgi:hypothetical protein